MNYNFEWDPGKARQNRSKHGVAFEQAATVFNDPRAMTLFDDTHSTREERWITMGISAAGSLLVVHHTFEEEAVNSVRIRMFSCRKATKHETVQYGE